MKLVTALFLSAKKHTYCVVRQVQISSYVIVVEKNDHDEEYKQENDIGDFNLKVFHVVFTPPMRFARLAPHPHFTQDFSLTNLLAFLSERELDPDKDWYPLEDDNEMIKPLEEKNK